MRRTCAAVVVAGLLLSLGACTREPREAAGTVRSTTTTEAPARRDGGGGRGQGGGQGRGDGQEQKPRFEIRETTACQALEQFRFAQLTVAGAIAKKDDQTLATGAAQLLESGSALKQAEPELTAAVDARLANMQKKASGVALTEAERQASQQANRALTAFRNESCRQRVGG